jgi:CheY-like chemotaxis protein
VEVEPEASLKFLEQLHQEDNPVPVIIYTERELSLEEEQSLQRCADNLTVKAVRTPERLLDEVTLFLHQVEALLPKEKQKILRMVHDKEAILAGKKVLVVDDDTRNIFALMSVLENKNMEVIAAQHGKEALEVLNEHPNMDIVLMDIMMPEMDGYETMQKIRAQPRFRKLPIIALTAKAMKSDKAKCIEAGASDYLAKPVDTDKLVSLMRVWLYR